MQPTLMLSYFKTLFQPPPPSAPTSLISQHLSTWRQASPLAEKEKEKHFLKTQRVGFFFFFFSNIVFLIKVCALCVGFFGYNVIVHFRASLVAQTVKCLPTMRETWVQSLGWEDPLEKENGYPLQYSGLENSKDCIVQGVAKSRTRLSDFHFHFHI